MGKYAKQPIKGKGFFKNIRKGVRKGFKKVRKGVRKGVSAVRKTAAKVAKNRFVKASRRLLDAGLGSIPVVGQAYGLADLGLRGTRAAVKGKFGKFIKNEALSGLRDTAMEAVAPGSTLVRDASKAASGAAQALITGKGACGTCKARTARIRGRGHTTHHHRTRMVRRD